MKNISIGTKALLNRLAAEKKKGITALCLIAIMAFMWIRVLTRETPRSAEAETQQDSLNADASGSNSQPNISYKELSRVTGRNDKLTRNFFAAEGWKDFVKGEGRNTDSINEASIVSGNGDEEVAKRVAKRLKLDAIVRGGNPRVFINDKLLAVGDSLFVRDGPDDYECEVIGIEEKRVFIRCGEAKIILKIAQEIEVSQ